MPPLSIVATSLVRSSAGDPAQLSGLACPM